MALSENPRMVQGGHDLVGGHHLLASPPVLRIQRHLLDETQVQSLTDRPAQQIAASWSLTPRNRTLLIFTGSSSASCAARIPASVSTSRSRWVIALNVSRSKVSRLTLTLCKPASRNGAASPGSRNPLVVMLTSTPRFAIPDTMSTTSGRSNGSAAGQPHAGDSARHRDPDDPQ